MARLLRQAGSVEVHVVPSGPSSRPDRPSADGGGAPSGLTRATRRRRVSLPPGRLALGWLLAILAPAVAVAIAVPFRSSLGLAGALFLELTVVVLVSVVGGLLPGLLATAIGFLLADFFFAVPFHSLRVDHLIDLVALVAFAAVAVVVGVLVDVLTRQALHVARGRAEADGVTRLLADTLAEAPEVVAGMTGALRRTFDLDAAAVLRRSDHGWAADAVSGDALPSPPESAPVLIEVEDGRALALVPGPPGAPEGLLATFIDQLSVLRPPLDSAPANQSGATSSSGSDAPLGTPSGTNRMPEPGSVMK